MACSAIERGASEDASPEVWAAQAIANAKADAVVAEHFQPQAFCVLYRVGMDIFVSGPGRTVRQVVQDLNAGELTVLHMRSGSAAQGQPGRPIRGLVVCQPPAEHGAEPGDVVSQQDVIEALTEQVEALKKQLEALRRVFGRKTEEDK
jgi:predicted Fe-Mo cluster-binding NifX family protein